MTTRTAFLLIGTVLFSLAAAVKPTPKDSSSVYPAGYCPDTSGFSIYLSPSKLYKKTASEIDLKRVEVDTTPLLTLADIRSYYKESHIIELDPAAFSNLQARWQTLSNRLFLVSSRHKILYCGIIGVVDTSFYKQDYEGPYLYLPESQDSTAYSNYLVIQYEDPAGQHDDAFDDERFNSEVYKVISKAGKLRLPKTKPSAIEQ